MSSRETTGTRSARFWNDERRYRVRRWLVIVAAIIVVSQWIRIILRPQGDFTLHWLFGQRLLSGEFLYQGGMHRPYPPFWAMACAPLTILPMATIRALVYPLGLIPLAVLLALVNRLARPHLPLRRDAAFWATALALVLASRFVIRELPECGANTMIVALTWAGVFFWCRGWDRLGGVSLGLAIALKCTPALMAAYFAWKRQWRLVAASAVTAGVLTLLPVVVMGPWSYVTHMRTWLGAVIAGVSEPSPLQGVLGDEEPWNLSLRPAIGRYLVAVPPTHKGFIDHPWRVQLIDLPPAQAGWIVKGVLAGLLAGAAAVMGRAAPRRSGVAVLWECAAVSILMLLLSPITWRQHCVGTIPAFVLIARMAVSKGRLPGWMTALVSVHIVLVLVLDRGLIGRDLTILLDGYGVTAIALLSTLAAVLGGRALAIRQDAERAEARVLSRRVHEMSRRRLPWSRQAHGTASSAR